MILINLMKHDINLEAPGKASMIIPASGKVATVIDAPGDDYRLTVDGVGSVPVSVVETSVIGVPRPQEGVGYIVTYKTLHAVHSLGLDTADLFAPDLLIKDESGRVSGCRRLMQMRTGTHR